MKIYEEASEKAAEQHQQQQQQQQQRQRQSTPVHWDESFHTPPAAGRGISSVAVGRSQSPLSTELSRKNAPVHSPMSSRPYLRSVPVHTPVHKPMSARPSLRSVPVHSPMPSRPSHGLQLVREALGGAVQVDPIKPTLKAPGSERLKLNCDELLSSFAFKLKLRHYNWEGEQAAAAAATMMMLTGEGEGELEPAAAAAAEAQVAAAAAVLTGQTGGAVTTRPGSVSACCSIALPSPRARRVRLTPRLRCCVRRWRSPAPRWRPRGMGLHSSTSQLNLSRF